MQEQWERGTKEHFYHLGGSKSNRNSMLEALILNYPIPKTEEKKVLKQLLLF